MSRQAEYYYYYLQQLTPPGPTYDLPPIASTSIVYMKAHWMLELVGNTLNLSEDAGQTFTKSMVIDPSVGMVKYYHIFDDGSLLFCTHDKAYNSSDFLSYSESDILDLDGSPLVVTGLDNFGQYMHDRNTQKVDNLEMLVWGNYSNVGPPIRLWYTIDRGATIKCCYKFNTAGQFQCSHVHNTLFNPADNSFWILTGDDPDSECRFIKSLYDVASDTWSFSEIAPPNLKYKSTNMLFYEEYVYFTWDTTIGGISRCRYDELHDSSKFVSLFVTPNDCLDAIMSVKGELIVIQSYYGGSNPTTNIWYSPDRVNFHMIQTDADFGENPNRTCFYGLRGPNVDGRVLAGINKPGSQNWDLTPSYFLDDAVRRAGFPNAFNPL